MFEIGEYVTYGFNGICQVEDVTHMDITGASKDTLYYQLGSLMNNGSKMYVPVENQRIVVRKVMTEEEAWALINEIPSIEEMEVKSDKQREGMYKDALKTCDCREWVRIIKTSYHRKQERIRQGKKSTATDDKYFKQAKDILYNELAFVLKKEKVEMEDLIINHLESKE